MMKSLFQGAALRAACLLAAVLAAAPAARAADASPANRIEAINVAAQGGRVLVKISLSQPLANPPASFTLNNPPRIALDFPDTANALEKSSQDVRQGDLRSYNIVQAGNRTRLVLNLDSPTSVESRLEGKDVILTLAGATPAGEVAPSRFAEAKPGVQQHSIRDIDFRRGRDGQGRILVELSDPGTGIDIRPQGKTLVIEFAATELPKNLQRRLDVVDFGTPVQFVDAFAQGDRTRVVIEPKGLWEHVAYQADNRFIVEIKPVAADPSRTTGIAKPSYSGDKLSLNFQNVEVRAVLQVLADFTGLNIITSDTVGGNLTLRLKDVPWDQALDIILQAKGLDMRRNGNVILIAPRDELATKEKLELEARQQLSELEPTQTESFVLNYQKAEDVKKLLSDEKQKILSKRGSVVVDPRTNTLFVQDTGGKLDEVRALIKKIDIAVRQVLIEARIVEATDNFSRSLGVRLGIVDRSLGNAFQNVVGADRAVIGGSLNAVGELTTQQQPRPTGFDPDSLLVNLPAAGIGTRSPANFTISLFNDALTKFLNLEISALEADGKGKVISSPRVVTADQVEARIEQGTEVPYQQATSSGATSVAFKKAVLSLAVKPQITPDGNIIMTLRVNKDSVDRTIPTSVPSIDTKQIETQVLVEDGGTVVIGGIFTQTETNTVTKVPFLGDLPGVGVFFREKQKVDNKTELLIFITPRIMKDTLTSTL